LRHTHILPSDEQKNRRFDQMLVDPAGLNDWVAAFEVDLVRSRADQAPAIRLRRLGSLV